MQSALDRAHVGRYQRLYRVLCGSAVRISRLDVITYPVVVRVSGARPNDGALVWDTSPARPVRGDDRVMLFLLGRGDETGRRCRGSSTSCSSMVATSTNTAARIRQTVLRLVVPGGIILWDDLEPYWHGRVRGRGETMAGRQ